MGTSFSPALLSALQTAGSRGGGLHSTSSASFCDPTVPHLASLTKTASCAALSPAWTAPPRSMPLHIQRENSGQPATLPSFQTLKLDFSKLRHLRQHCAILTSVVASALLWTWPSPKTPGYSRYYPAAARPTAMPSQILPSSAQMQGDHHPPIVQGLGISSEGPPRGCLWCFLQA